MAERYKAVMYKVPMPFMVNITKILNELPENERVIGMDFQFTNGLPLHQTLIVYTEIKGDATETLLPFMDFKKEVLEAMKQGFKQLQEERSQQVIDIINFLKGMIKGSGVK